MNQLPPLNGLRAFETAGRHLNFRAAADEMGVTQGAVAQQVRGLEAHLGVQLFERRSKGLSFTAAGRSYHARIADGFTLLRKATNALRPELAKVVISVTPSFASKWLIPNLPDFTARNPDIDLRILATESVSGFHTDGIDLAIRQAQPPFGASLEAHLLFRQEIIAVAAPALIERLQLPLAPEEFGSLTRLHDTHELWPQFLAQLSLNDESGRAMQFNQTALAIEAAVAGQGIALASRFLVEKDLRTKRLVQVSSTCLRGQNDFYLLARRGARRSSAIDTVLSWLLAQSTGSHSPLKP